MTRLEGINIKANAAAQGNRANTVVNAATAPSTARATRIVAGQLDYSAGERR